MFKTILVIFLAVYLNATGLIGVTDIQISNKTAALIFNKDGLQTETVVALQDNGAFNVLDIQRLKDVIQRHKIEWSEIENSESERIKLKDILAVDYFLIVAISSFSDDISYSSSFWSKTKIETVKIKVDLIIKNALTNRIIKSVSGYGEESKELTQTLGFGASGNQNGELPNKVFLNALKEGITKLEKISLPKIENKTIASNNQKDLKEQNSDNSDKSQDVEIDPFALLSKKSNSNHCEGKWIESNGLGSLEKGLYIAKKSALMDAYRNAVSKGAGVHIEDFTQIKMTESMSNVYSVINKKSKGFITYYEIINQGRKNSQTYMTYIKACVANKQVDNFTFNNGIKTFVKMLGSPKVLIVFGQERYSEDILESKTITGKNSTRNYISKKDEMQIRSIETNIAKILKMYGYEVITSDDMANRGIIDSKRILEARKGIGGSAIEFAREVGADIVISGNIIYALSRNELYDIDSKMVTATIDAKAMMPGSGKIVGIYNKQGKSISLIDDQLTAKESAIKILAKKISKDIIIDVPKYLLNEERDIEIQFTNITYRDLRKVKKVLKNQKEILGIQSSGRWRKTQGKKGKVHLIVQTSFLGVTTDDIMDNLENNGFNFDINEATDYFINLEFR